MYFLEFEELNKNADKACIVCPFVIDVTHDGDMNEEFISEDELQNFETAVVKSVVDPLIKFIKDDPDLTVDSEDYYGDDTSVIVCCDAENAESAVERLVAKCNELDNSFSEESETFTLDRDLPYEDQYDPFSYYGHYQVTKSFSDPNDEDEYFHSTMTVRATFKFDMNRLEYL